ncbi:MAG: hypothetical protein WB615_15555 [Candidatus Tumulicola sp.]
MTQPQLDDLFTRSPAGAIPNGEARGTAILAPGTPLSDEIAEAIELFAWQGKTFDAARGTLVNSVSPLRVHAVAAQVYVAPSWSDGKPCIVLDYSKTSVVAHWVRDEIRLVAPNVYLGVAFWWRKRIINFSLEFF